MRLAAVFLFVLMALGVNAQKCPDSCSYYIPNTLTPDCDEADCQYLEIRSECTFKELDFTIFNRWGEIIFHTTDPKKRFDSTEHQEGTYFWTISGEFCNEKNINGNGYINLLR